MKWLWGDKVRIQTSLIRMGKKEGILQRKMLHFSLGFKITNPGT